MSPIKPCIIGKSEENALETTLTAGPSGPAIISVAIEALEDLEFEIVEN